MQTAVSLLQGEAYPLLFSYNDYRNAEEGEDGIPVALDEPQEVMEEEDCRENVRNFGPKAISSCARISLNRTALGQSIVRIPSLVSSTADILLLGLEKAEQREFVYRVDENEQDEASMIKSRDEARGQGLFAVFVSTDQGVTGNIPTNEGFAHIAPCRRRHRRQRNAVNATTVQCHTITQVLTRQLDDKTLGDTLEEEEPGKEPVLGDETTAPGDAQCTRGVPSIDYRYCCEPGDLAGCGEPTRSCYYHSAPCYMVVIQTVAVAYTNLVRQGISDVVGLVRLAVAETNQAYLKSQIPIQLELAESSPYLETEALENGNANQMLTSFKRLTNAKFSSHPNMRMLIVASTQSCGIAYLDCAQYADYTCYAVVQASCATGYYSFGHELGHLQGANHNIETSGADNKDNHGHVMSRGYGQFGAYRTIMAYSIEDELRVAYFSNPNVLVEGRATGVVGVANNARVLRATRYAVAKTAQGTERPTRLPTNTAFPTTQFPTQLPTSSSPTVANEQERFTSAPSFELTSPPTLLPTLKPSMFPTTAEPTLSPTIYPTRTPTVEPSFSPSASPTIPLPTLSPTMYPSRTPTMEPTFAPSAPPTTPLPTLSPTVYPSRTPTMGPTFAPSASPTTAEPTLSPTIRPSRTPTMEPTFSPSTSPTTPLPTLSPTMYPSNRPTMEPTFSPSASPSTPLPTLSPTPQPTNIPTLPLPTLSPTLRPTNIPTTLPPTKEPTSRPSSHPTTPRPSRLPTNAPTSRPTWEPTSKDPTTFPTSKPTPPKPTQMPTPLILAAEREPTVEPTFRPTYHRPTIEPTFRPTYHRPTIEPTFRPTFQRPTLLPTVEPTGLPTRFPSLKPTRSPITRVPTVLPTNTPTESTDSPTWLPTTQQPTRTPQSPSAAPLTNSPTQPTTFAPTPTRFLTRGPAFPLFTRFPTNNFEFDAGSHDDWGRRILAEEEQESMPPVVITITLAAMAGIGLTIAAAVIVVAKSWSRPKGKDRFPARADTSPNETTQQQPTTATPAFHFLDVEQHTTGPYLTSTTTQGRRRSSLLALGNKLPLPPPPANSE